VRRLTRRTVVAALAATGVTALAGCARPVAVPGPDPSPDQPAAAACAAFTAALPEQLSTVGTRRRVDPPSTLTAAYGDPPVALRCGVPRPAALTATSTLVTVDGIDWFPEELTGGWLMTTTGLVANVEITVPAAQGPAPSVAADLAPTITASPLQP
jgi:Protein of unknown function (DUF3515)